MTNVYDRKHTHTLFNCLAFHFDRKLMRSIPSSFCSNIFMFFHSLCKQHHWLCANFIPHGLHPTLDIFTQYLHSSLMVCYCFLCWGSCRKNWNPATLSQDPFSYLKSHSESNMAMKMLTTYENKSRYYQSPSVKICMDRAKLALLQHNIPRHDDVLKTTKVDNKEYRVEVCKLNWYSH